MNEGPSARVAVKSDIDHRLLIPFLTHVTLTQALILIIRDHDLLPGDRARPSRRLARHHRHRLRHRPAFTALPVGRWIDRGNDAKAIWVGSALVFVACIGFWAWPHSATHLLAYSVLLGFGHMFCMAGHQMLAVRSGGARSGRTCWAITWSRLRSDRGSARSS